MAQAAFTVVLTLYLNFSVATENEQQTARCVHAPREHGRRVGAESHQEESEVQQEDQLQRAQGAIHGRRLVLPDARRRRRQGQRRSSVHDGR